MLPTLCEVRSYEQQDLATCWSRDVRPDVAVSGSMETGDRTGDRVDWKLARWSRSGGQSFLLCHVGAGGKGLLLLATQVLATQMHTCSRSQAKIKNFSFNQKLLLSKIIIL